MYENLINKAKEVLIKMELSKKRLENLQKELLTPNQIRKELGLKEINWVQTLCKQGTNLSYYVSMKKFQTVILSNWEPRCGNSVVLFIYIGVPSGGKTISYRAKVGAADYLYIAQCKDGGTNGQTIHHPTDAATHGCS
jgi:hypothetical protein